MFVNLGYVSDGGPYGGGQRDAEDVTDAVAWAGQTLKLPVVLLGFSAGAPVAAVVSDSGFVGFRDVVAFRAGVSRAFTALTAASFSATSTLTRAQTAHDKGPASRCAAEQR